MLEHRASENGIIRDDKSDVTPNIRGECVVDGQETGISTSNNLSLFPTSAVPRSGMCFVPCRFWHWEVAALACLPFPQQCRGLDTHPWLPIMMGLVHPQGAAFEVHKAHIMRGTAACWRKEPLSGGTAVQVKMREGEGTESHFPHASPCQSCLALCCHWWGSHLAPQQVTWHLFQAVWLAQWKCCLHCLGRGPPQTGCSSTSGAPCDTWKALGMTGRAELIGPADEQTGSCLLPAEWHVEKLDF